MKKEESILPSPFSQACECYGTKPAKEAIYCLLPIAPYPTSP